MNNYFVKGAEIDSTYRFMVRVASYALFEHLYVTLAHLSNIPFSEKALYVEEESSCPIDFEEYIQYVQVFRLY